MAFHVRHESWILGEEGKHIVTDVRSETPRSHRRSECFEDLEALWLLRWEGEASPSILYKDFALTSHNGGTMHKLLQILGFEELEDDHTLKPGPCEEFAEMGIPEYPSEWYWNV